MKVNNKQRIIIDDDIIVTSPRNLGDSLKDVIDEQRKDIETLKKALSRMKEAGISYTMNAVSA